jgi:phosphoserine phosphatase
MAIATLIAAGRLDDRLVERALELLRAVDPACRFAGWIDEGDAADLSFEGDLSLARTALEALPGIDLVVQNDAPRLRRLLVADMDSTMIGQECIDELADYAGVKPQVAKITEWAMRGELDFAGALRERVALLRGLDAHVIDRCLTERIRPSPGAAALVRTMRAKGAETILVSGGFTAFVAPIAEQIGFDRYVANVLGIANGALTGVTEGSVVDSAVKHQVLVEARERLGLSTEDTLAIGDGANDIPMVIEAGLGVAFHAKPALALAAQVQIRHGELSALLWAQRIPRTEWVTA